MKPLHFIFLISQLLAWQIDTWFTTVNSSSEFTLATVTSKPLDVYIDKVNAIAENQRKFKAERSGHILECDWYMVNAAMNIPLSEEQSHSNLEALINCGICFTYSCQYKEAEGTYKKLINLYPQNPAGYYYLAALYQTIMRNYRVRKFEPQFEKFIDLAIEIAEEALKNDRNNAVLYMYLGNARGHRGVHRINQQKFFRGFMDGLKGASYLEKSIELHPTLYDAYYGAGIYHYWRSAKSKCFWFLPFIGDNRQKGIDEIWLSIEKGRHSEIEGKYALVSIYYNEKDYEKAYQLNQQLCSLRSPTTSSPLSKGAGGCYGSLRSPTTSSPLSKGAGGCYGSLRSPTPSAYGQLFPDNPAAMYMKGLIEEKHGKWQEAQQTFQQLLSHLLASEYKSLGYQAECHYRIAFYLSQEGQFDEAIKECEIALKLGEQRDASKELEDALSNTEDILKEARKLYEKLLERQSFSKP